MYPHRINLREPWQATPQHQRVSFRRVFNWPTELMPFEQLWLVVGWADAPIQVTLNQQLLGSQQDAGVPLEVNITSQVQNQNLLEISCLLAGAADQAQGRIRSVFLEVRRSVHLNHILGKCLWSAEVPIFELTAQVDGPVERNLSIVVRLNDKEVHYEELGMAEKPVLVNTKPLNVPRWIPGQANALQTLEVQLLDPACVLAQHHYLTGFVDRDVVSKSPVEDFPVAEPIFESAWLEEADRLGRLVRMKEVPLAARLRYLWHHPCLVNVTHPSAPAVP